MPAAGILLAFPGPLSPTTKGGARACRLLRTLLSELNLFREEHLVGYVVLAEPPDEATASMLLGCAGPHFNFLIDGDGALARLYGVEAQPGAIVLDAMLRVVAKLDLDAEEPETGLIQMLRGLPPVADSVGVPLSAPVLIVPRVFEFALCDFLVQLYDETGGTESGFLFDRDGQSATVIDPKMKRRRDLVLGDPALRELIRARVAARIVPAIRRFFQFEATRMDRTMISCYDAASASEGAGHFYRHRDDVNAGARHRRFAMTLGLNKEFEGGELRFPEFGPSTYRAPVGGALVFSCGMLHEVLPVTAGKRLVFVPFLYGEADAALRLSQNAALAGGETPYSGTGDLLFPAPEA